MNRDRIWPHAAALLAVVATGGARAEGGEGAAASIRALRLQYNHAIESRDPGAFAKFLSPTFVELTSSGEVTRGAKAVADSYADTEFKDPTFIAYDRRPDTIDVARSGRFAVERGHWRARFRAPGGGEAGATGLYQAGWIKMGDGWRIRTEAYAQMTCKREPAC